jgi:hypothetical protein
MDVHRQDKSGNYSSIAGRIMAEGAGFETPYGLDGSHSTKENTFKTEHFYSSVFSLAGTRFRRSSFLCTTSKRISA